MESVKYEDRQSMCYTNPSSWPLLMWNMKNMVEKGQTHIIEKLNHFLWRLLCISIHIYVPFRGIPICIWCVSLLLYIRLSHILCVTNWMALTTWTLSYSAIAVCITYVLFLYIYWNGWNGSHNMSLKLATYEVFFFAALCAVCFCDFAAALWICERLCVSSG